MWLVAIDTWDESSYHQARARWRFEDALLGTDPDDPDIEPDLDLAQDVAERLGAQPLLSAIERLRQRSTDT